MTAGAHASPTSWPTEVVGGPCSDDSRTAARVLGKLREQLLLASPEIQVVDAVFDDLEAVLGEFADPTAADVAELTPRLHAVFRRIAYVAREPSSGVRPETIAEARSLLDERFPRDFLPARAHLRRLAMTVGDLLDELLEDMP